MDGVVQSLNNALLAGPAHLPWPSSRLVLILWFELISTFKWCGSFRLEKGHWVFSQSLNRGSNMSIFALNGQQKDIFWYEALSLKLLATVWIYSASRDVVCLSKCYRGVLYHYVHTHKLWLKATLEFMVGSFTIILMSQMMFACHLEALLFFPWKERVNDPQELLYEWEARLVLKSGQTLVSQYLLCFTVFSIGLLISSV